MTLAARATELAVAQRPLRRPPSNSPPLLDLDSLAAAIADASRELRTQRPADPQFQKAAEWFLDNHFLVARTARQVATEIPPSFRRRLPHAGKAPHPRILELANALVSATSLELDESMIVTFVQAYEEHGALTLAELWAFPAMIRITTLEALARALRIVLAPKSTFADAPHWEQAVPASVRVERAIRVLRLLSEIDWKSFVERTSAVEATLHEDPLGVYALMDFEARDVYRKVVESLAWDTELAEPEVARMSVDLAATPTAHERERHVGYYLVDAGLATLKARIGYRPRGIERVRSALLARPTLAYLGAIGLLTFGPLAAFVARERTMAPALLVLACVLGLVPVSSIAVAIVNAWVTRILVPRRLPKLDFAVEIPEDCRTAIVVPALVSSTADFDHLFAQLELHYLSCPDPALAYVLLTDHIDAHEVPDDTAILAHAADIVASLNAKYAGAPFHVLHREAKWNEGERRFMGWERKRGKLDELNRLLRGDEATSFKHHLGARSGLEKVRFVITLDADTQLPVGAARKLVGLAAHPLNAARVDERTGRVTSGYTIAQPRVEASPALGADSLFSRMWSGDTALDIYTHATSDVYQDLFGSGAYVGKAIYEVDAFMRSVEGRVPANSIASHDLFEGVHGRAALATDIVLFEQYPHDYLSFARRMHRWLRGDWQLLPWLLPRVPSASGEWLPNRLTVVDRWKILDNLRRSLLAPSLLLFFFGLLAFGPANALVLVPLLFPLAVSSPALLDGNRRQTLGRWALGLAFLPHEAWIAADAIVRAVVRMAFTRRNMLQWVTAAATARGFEHGSRDLFWREMGPMAVLTTTIGIALGALRPSTLFFVAPVLLVWLLAPEIARIASVRDTKAEPLTEADHRVLRLLARRTWLFFETFVGPTDQWLAPDNFQEEPGRIIAHRTSPTNIGLMFVAQLCAFDLGYIGRAELAALVRQSLDTLGRLERYRGHWLNWYDTRTLAPLLPRYVSTVDSGNLAAALVTLAKGCRDAAHAPALRPIVFEGLGDTLDLLEESLESLEVSHTGTLAPIATLRASLARGRTDIAVIADVARVLADVELPALEAELVRVIGDSSGSPDLATFRDVQTWLARLRHQVRSIQGDVAASDGDDTLRDDLLGLAERVDAANAGFDFTFLFNRSRKLFHIGYDATSDRLDANFYDLLASEARIASYLAIVLGQVPPEHWMALGRPITRIQGKAALLSWGGTMFEYLMPTLFMRSQERTLLLQSAELAVACQIENGRKAGIPWGVSESGFAQLDPQENYQYRSFGAPGLGLRRGLEEDRVIAPYATVLSLPFRPRAVLANLAVYDTMQAVGLYGLYESVDYDEERALETSRITGETVRKYAIVRSHMAHHQGMILAALNNAINDDVLVDRFHAGPIVKTGEVLLSERLPSVRVAEDLAQPAETTDLRPAAIPSFPGWVPVRSEPQIAFLGNGRLGTTVTDSGAGVTTWNGLAITRGGMDAAHDAAGTWIYVRDEENGNVWSATPAPTRPRRIDDEVLFGAHQVEILHRDGGISLRTEIAIAASDDIEVRRVTLHNESVEPRELSLFTYAEPVLEPAASAARQPAFSRMFVECEPVVHGVLVSRRTRSPEDPIVIAVQTLVWDDPTVSWVGAEVDRRAFLGRCHDMRAPEGFVRADAAPLTGRSAPLDPVIALAVRVKLAPHAHVTLALVTAVAKTREIALDLTRRFGTLRALKWAVHDARLELARRLDRDGMAPALLPSAMALASRLLLPTAAHRMQRARLEDPYPTQSSLWGHGISGDDPLLVVRVRSRAHDAIISEVLTIYRFLRARGVKTEVVFLDDASSGYHSEEPGSVRGVLMLAGAGVWLDQRGGIFVRALDKISVDDRTRIGLAAQVLLDSANGSVAAQLANAPVNAPLLPTFGATRARDVESTPLLPVPALGFDANGHGGFSEDGREYVIRVVPGRSTPAPWCNVLANAEAGCLVSESSLGATWAGNSGENRLTPWRNDPVTDTPSEVLYLRDEETADLWSPTPLPAGRDAEVLVRHGAGYTTYERESHGLHQVLTVFVPAAGPVKILRLAVTNRLPRARRLTATYYLEWVLGALRDVQRAHVLTEHDPATHSLLARCGWNADFSERVAFVTADRPLHGFTCDRTELLGRSGSYERPAALARWGLSGTAEGGADPCAAVQIHIDLAPGESTSVHFVLGQGQDRDHALELVRHFRLAGAIDKAWTALHAFWDDVLGAVDVKTPEPAMDLLLNRWLLYQSLSSRVLGRTAFFQSSGAFGYRDQLQDVMALVHGAPELARAHILVAAAHQFEEGDVQHWWHPPADRGVRTRCSDDMAWLPFVTAHYVATTGDKAILDEPVAFLSAPPLGPTEHDRYSQFATTRTKSSLLEHCRRALVRATTEGAHGLPLIGDSDWNDGMNHIGVLGRGESVWLAFFLCATMKDFAVLCDATEAASWRARAAKLGTTIDASTWDGAWYLRAFYDDGTALGGAGSRACEIDSIAQSWAVLSGAVDPVRATRALASADTHLVLEKERLVLVLEPPFGNGGPNPGYIRAYPPGIRENGGQYTHAATWLGFAHAREGDGDGAERIFRLLNPVHHGASAAAIERYRVEPYVLAGDVYGAPPFVGRGGWTWYTGAAAWLWRLGVEEILGLRKENGGLRVDPCIPKSWPGFEATVRLGDHECHVIVDNTSGAGHGVASMTLDGVAVTSTFVQRGTGAGRRKLRVVLGTAALEAAS